MNKYRDFGEIDTNEDFRIYIDEIFRDFERQQVEQYEFPTGLTRQMRKYVHEKCRKRGIKSKSFGKEPNRILMIFSKRSNSNFESFILDLSDEALSKLNRFNRLHSFDTQRRTNVKRFKGNTETIGRLFSGQLQTVDRAQPNPLLEFRKTLPIYSERDSILDYIEKNPLVIVSAETGSGKTTQVPQYILDDACANGKSVRVICTQPRRLSTIAVANRVAMERGERIGLTVGYQIKLESQLGARTSLIYCTNGVLLRTLMGGVDCLQNVSHIIVDEIHERDKFTDFLLICLRECLSKNPKIRIILMSATMDMEVFLGYFRKAQIVHVPGRAHSVTTYFLDDILPNINYENSGMKRMRELRERNGCTNRQVIVQPRPTEVVTPDLELATELNDTIKACFERGDDEVFTHLMQLILTESISPNYQETEGGTTALMAAARHGNLQVLEQLLNLGADPFISCENGMTASGCAQQQNRDDIVNLLAMYQGAPPVYNSQVTQILADYDRTVNEENIDFALLVDIIKYIRRDLDPSGAILIFMPGYDDIMSCCERISNSNIPSNSYKIFMLHGSMQMGAQHDVFNRTRPGVQKIILSTNLAETSITIDDVVYVIDSGKAKEKSYDAISGVSSLRTQWISMASARQRSGRAGRTREGFCFHMYSFNRYESLCVNATPEILRVPLHELCLQTKMLAPSDMPIETFLKLAIEPPSTLAVEKSIHTLKHLGALDDEERLTDLGHHLVQLSIEPYLGKILIYATIFKCLDPVLTIVACLAHKDPFILPTQSSLKLTAITKRKELSEDCLSDHMALIRVFQKWQDSRIQDNAYRFCEEYFVSPSTMDLIMMTRSQLLSQLRAIGFVQSNPRDNMHELNQHSECWPLIKACLATGLYPNVAFYNDRKLHTRTEKSVNLNMASSLKSSEFEYPPGSNFSQKCWLIFEEISKNNVKCSIKCATAVTPLSVTLMCGLECRSEQDTNTVILDDWFEFNFSTNCDNLVPFRSAIESVVNKKITNPRYKICAEEDDAIKMLVTILSIEDIKYGLKCPAGIGNRPKLLHAPISSYEESNARKQRLNYAPQYNQGRNNNRGNNTYQRNNPYTQNQGNHSNWNNKNQYRNQQWYNGGGNDSRGSNPLASTSNSYGGNRNSDAGSSYNNGFPNASETQPMREKFNSLEAGPSSSERFSLNTSYFVIKPCELKNITIAMMQNAWNFAPQTEKKLFKEFAKGNVIILIFSVRGANNFNGVARLVSNNCGTPNRPCPIQWITKNTIPFEAVKYYIHPKIHARDDGTQLPNSVGRQLCIDIENAINDLQRPILGKFNRRY